MTASAPGKAPGAAEALPTTPGSVQGDTAHPEPAKSSSGLGLKIGGSAKTGHTITVTRNFGLTEIFGTEDPEQALALLGHGFRTLKGMEAGDAAGTDERQFLLSIIRDLGPRDAVERMLVVQMAATHVALIRAGDWLSRADNLPQVEAHYTGYTKMARTFAAQVEALQRHRRGGKQTVVVQHVNVAEGGQAIVGHVETGGRGSHERER